MKNINNSNRIKYTKKVLRVITFLQSTWLDSILKTDFLIAERLLQFFLDNPNFDKLLNINTLSRLMVLNRLLFEMSGVKYSNLTFESLLKHVQIVTDMLYNYKKQGYVNANSMIENSVYGILRSIFIEQKDVFTANKTRSIFELEHFHNLILLCLILEFDLFLSTKSKWCNLTEDQIAEYDYVKIMRLRIMNNITAPIRSSLSKGRLNFIMRTYTGFDTEYNTVDNTKTKLLCYTTATHSDLLLRIKKIRLDYTIVNYHGAFDSKPAVYKELECLVSLIRLVNGKNDLKIDQLLDNLKSDTLLETLETESSFLIKFKPSNELTPADFITRYVDLLTNPSVYSFSKLVADSVSDGSLKIEKELSKFKTKLTSLNYDIVQKNKIALIKEVYLIAHFTTADITSWSDFDAIKGEFSILRKSFVTIDRVIKLDKWRVYLRDTSLLTPTLQSLGAIGNLYPDKGLSKIDLPLSAKNNMEQFMSTDFKTFKEYALRDSVITLFHSLIVQQSYYDFCGIYTIPITLSSLASNYLAKQLIGTQNNSKYFNPVINGKFGMKTLKSILSPIGIELSGDLHEYIDYFLGAYHGGRNESYIYGQIKGVFYDYDLPGAYPTGMSLVNYPDWSAREVINSMDSVDFMKLYEGRLVRSFTALKVEFQFPDSVMYPNLPVRLDQSSIIFPSQGISYCTGLEILLAYRLGCEFKVIGGSFIPFIGIEDKNQTVLAKPEGEQFLDVVEPRLTECYLKFTNFFKSKRIVEVTENQSVVLKKESIQMQSEVIPKDVPSVPINDIIDDSTLVNSKKDLFTEFPESAFYLVVKELTAKRALYPKKSYNNLLYKFIANAGIGQMARGLNNKKVFDVKTNSTVFITPGPLINPLYAGWITSFIRTVLSEIMNEVHRKGGKIISCTTDGFITDLSELDFLQIDGVLGEFSRLYKLARVRLDFSDQLLEIKFTEKIGIISWSTRGQLGVDSLLKAMTGYQATVPHNELVPIIKEAMDTTKQINFVQFSLRSALDAFKSGGTVTPILSERVFNLKYDNRRLITGSLDSTFEINNQIENLNSTIETINKSDIIDKPETIESTFQNDFMFTKPHADMIDCLKNRKLAVFGTKRFNTYYPGGVSNSTKSESYLVLTKRILVRALLQHPEFFGLDTSLITRQFIVDFLAKYKVKCLMNFVSKQKDAPFIGYTLPQTKSILYILNEIAKDYPVFKENLFRFMRK